MRLLKELVTIRKGKKLNLSNNSHIRYIQIEDLRNDDNLKYCEIDDNTVLCQESDILIAWDGANAGTIGYGLTGAIGSTIAKLTLKDGVNFEYLGRFLQSKSNYLRDNCTGATIPHISSQVLGNLKIPLPTLETQQKIAAILDQADALRQNDRKILEHYDRLAQSVFLEMFGDPVTNPRGFQVDCLKNLYINELEGTKCGPFGSALKKDEYKYYGIPVWTMDNIQGMTFREDNCLFIDEEKFRQLIPYKVKNGDIIISRAGTVGKMCVVNSRFSNSIISTNLIKLSLNSEKLLPLYFVSLMNYTKGRVGRLKTGKDGAFTHMNTGILANLKFPVPSISLQNRFAEIIHQIEQQKQITRQSLQKSEELFQSLLQRAFRGELG